jgi:[ribosomal protein S5]-alanine N-acetyltransferase
MRYSDPRNSWKENIVGRDNLVAPLTMTNMARTLKTARLILRPFQSDDLELFLSFFANEGFIRFSTGNFSRERVSEFVTKVIGWDRDGLPSQFVVHVRDTSAPIGYCGFFHQEVDDTPEIEIGYRLHPDYWNQGFATEAACAVRDHGFGALNLRRLISLIHPDNTASRRVAEKNGMQLEKATTFKGFAIQVFAISREQWLQLPGASKIRG